MTGTRERIITASGELFRHRGFAGTGMKQIVEQATAPYGSIYHFFPGGKDALAEEVIRTSGAAYQQMVLAVLDSVPEPLESLAHTFAVAADELAASDYADACPIATVALEVASSNERLRIATADVFDAWVSAGTAWFTRWIPDREAARWLAQSMIMLLEGAFLLSRATRNPEPLHAAGRAMVELAHPVIATHR